MFSGSVSPKSNFPALLEVGRPKKIQTHISIIYTYMSFKNSSETTLYYLQVSQFLSWNASVWPSVSLPLPQVDNVHLCNKATNPGVHFFVIHLSDLGKFPSKKTPLKLNCSSPSKILVFREKIWHLFGERMFCEISAQKLLVRAYSIGVWWFHPAQPTGRTYSFSRLLTFLP